jgi:hypothetical protein
VNISHDDTTSNSKLSTSPNTAQKSQTVNKTHKYPRKNDQPHGTTADHHESDNKTTVNTTDAHKLSRKSGATTRSINPNELSHKLNCGHQGKPECKTDAQQSLVTQLYAVKNLPSAAHDLKCDELIRDTVKQRMTHTPSQPTNTHSDPYSSTHNRYESHIKQRALSESKKGELQMDSNDIQAGIATVDKDQASNPYIRRRENISELEPLLQERQTNDTPDTLQVQEDNRPNVHVGCIM